MKLSNITKSISSNAFELVWIAFVGVVGRLIAPLPNFTPMTGLSLFSGTKLNRFLGMLFILAILFISDLCLSLLRGYPLFSYFTIFTYTGFVLIVLMSKFIKHAKWSLPFYVLGASTIFWLWTNFGVWLTSGLYSRSFSGLVACYYVALPFLRNAMIGDLILSGLIFGVFSFVIKRYKPNYNIV